VAASVGCSRYCRNGSFPDRLPERHQRLAEVGTEPEIDVLGENKPALIVPESSLDPDNERLRA